MTRKRDALKTIYQLRAQVANKQRRRAPDGRPLHACCLCDKLAPWDDGWRWYGSYKEEEDGVPVLKFCPSHRGPDIHLMAGPGDAEQAFLREYL